MTSDPEMDHISRFLTGSQKGNRLDVVSSKDEGFEDRQGKGISSLSETEMQVVFFGIHRVADMYCSPGRKIKNSV